MTPPLFHIAFYHFTRVREPEALALRLRELCAPLLGNVLVAHEGINGMLSGAADQLDAFQQALQTDAPIAAQVESEHSHPFAGIVFKRTACLSPPFKRLKIHAKREIVPLGIDGVDAPGRVDDIHACDVPPQQWRELIRWPDVVLLDNRNSFEYRLGHFEGAMNPGVVNFRDFPEYVKAHADAWKAQGKTVAMYCTGGIRCEKSSLWMQDMGLKVAQLQGGILNYFQAMPDAEKDWQGECFVFDNRVALDTKLQETATSIDDVYSDQDLADAAQAQDVRSNLLQDVRDKLLEDARWRLARAKRLDGSGGGGDGDGQ